MNKQVQGHALCFKNANGTDHIMRELPDLEVAEYYLDFMNKKFWSSLEFTKSSDCGIMDMTSPFYISARVFEAEMSEKEELEFLRAENARLKEAAAIVSEIKSSTKKPNNKRL